MSITTEIRTQADYYALAEQNIPGAGVGAYALPEELRFVAVGGEGSRLKAADGRWYIDYVGGAGANILGHCHPAVVEAIQQQAARGIHYFGHLNDAAIELAGRLVQHIPCADKIVFATTGSEATMYAMRMARATTGRPKVLKFEGGYHGNHDYSIVSIFPGEPAQYPIGKPSFSGVPNTLPDTMLVAPYNDLAMVEQIVAEHGIDLAAIIVEPVQRIIFPQPGFLPGLRDICDRHGIVLIFDEVVTGFRLAMGGAQEFFGVKPDLASYGKIVGGGGPLSCVAGRADLIENASPRQKGQPDYTWVNGTLHANPIAAAAGLATIKQLEEPDFYPTLHSRSTDLLKMLQSVLDQHDVPAIAAGQGSFWQLLFMESEPANAMDVINSDRAAMRALDIELLRRGIYVLPAGRRFVSAVNTGQDFEQTAVALDEACAAM
jgi:glutamate-1-semialdehyde 2,1-aminomutase